jgi:hypothetical protein
VGVVGAPSGGIELELKQISLPVAQIRVICINYNSITVVKLKGDILINKIISNSNSNSIFVNKCTDVISASRSKYF